MIHAGVDIGGTNIKVAIINQDGDDISIKTKMKFPNTHCGYEELCGQISEAINILLQQYNIDARFLTSIGVAVPGCIDESGKILLHAFNAGLHNAPIVDEISKHFEFVPVYMANDANAAALAELYCGTFKGLDTALLFTLGTGLGGGFIINGKLFNGGQNRGTEPGHLPFKKGDMPCTCGLSGCVERYTTATWIRNQGKEKLGDAYDDAKAVIDAAREGNPVAKAIFDEYIDNMGTFIGGICSCFDPQLVALGGGVSECGDILYKPLEKLVEQRNFAKYHYDIVPAKMGNDAGVLGAAMLYSESLK